MRRTRSGSVLSGSCTTSTIFVAPGLDVREDQASRDLAALGGRDGVHVPAELELEALEARGAGKAREVLGEVEGLHLVDDDAPAVLPAPVEAAFEDRRVVVDGERRETPFSTA